MPGWLTNYVSRDYEKSLKPKLARRANSMKRNKPARLQNLSPGWWLKRPKEVGSDVPAMERLVGPVAYRGRAQLIQRKSGRAAKPMGGRRKSTPIMNSDLVGRGIPHNTIRSEKQNRATRRSGPRRPS